MPGTLALVGGEEFTDGCTFDEGLVQGASKVLLVPTGRAYEAPGTVIETARKWFERLDVEVDPLEIYRREQALDEAESARVADASVIYVTGGSPMHMRSTLKDTPLVAALEAAWNGGATVVLAGEAAAVACSRMVDSRGGAITLGLDVIRSFAAVPKFNRWSPEKWQRTMELIRPDIPVVCIDEATAAIRAADGTWSAEGVGSISVYLAGERTDLSSLP